MKRDKVRHLRYTGVPWRGALCHFFSVSLHLTRNSIAYNSIIKPRSTLFVHQLFRTFRLLESISPQRYLVNCINIFVHLNRYLNRVDYQCDLPCTLNEKSNKTTELPLFAIQVGYIIALYLYFWLFSHSITRVCSNLNGLVLSIDKRLLYKGARQ